MTNTVAKKIKPLKTSCKTGKTVGKIQIQNIEYLQYLCKIIKNKEVTEEDIAKAYAEIINILIFKD